MEIERFKAVASGVLLNSALYLLTVFVAAVCDHNDVARDFTIATFGLTYLCYVAQLGRSRFAGLLTVLSVASGVTAGVVLIFPGGIL